LTLGKVPTILKNLYNKNAWTIEDEKESRKACDAKDLKAFEEAWLANHLKINDWWNAFAICVLFARNAAAVIQQAYFAVSTSFGSSSTS
jgi:hypothetical protein